MATLAFDIGGTNLRAGLLGDDARSIVDERKVPLDDRSVDGVVAACARIATALREDSANAITRVGVGLAAMIAKESGRVELSPNLEWKDVDFAGPLGAAIGVEHVALLNDLDAICLGEAAAGAAKGARDVVCAFVGTGVGSGLLVDGRPYAGFRGVGAELGHVKVGRDGRACGCGAVDCLEAYAGGRMFTARVRRELASAPSLASSLDATTVELDAVDALASTNAWADALVTEVAQHLGRAVANLCTVVNPQVLVFGGGVWEKCPALRERTVAAFHQDINAVAAVGLSIVDATLGDSAGLIGAAVAANALAPDPGGNPAR